MRRSRVLLTDGEHEIYTARRHVATLWKRALLSIAFLASWIVAANLSEFFRKPAILAISGFFLACLAAWLCARALEWSNTKVILTSRRLIFTTGVLRKESHEVLLTSISNVSVYQGFLDRIIGVGDIRVETGGEQEDGFYFQHLSSPQELKEEIIAQVNAARAGMTVDGASAIAQEVSRKLLSEQPTKEIVAIPPERPPLYSEIVDQIERLEALRKSNALSDEEFQRAKEALLRKLEEDRE